MFMEIATGFRVLINGAPTSFSQSEYPFSSSVCAQKNGTNQSREIWIIIVYTIPFGKGRWRKKSAECMYVITFFSSLRPWMWSFLTSNITLPDNL